ncbi:MAG: class I SAM-dependent methyltransferase [Pseudanabaenaceae cyanobacterium bins.39]|nr:class I SAM-dependent methyltransferase [Pseudanabaenaceae cyanobacterium bins.39]
MDLRNKNLSREDIEQAKRLIIEKQFWYQPFIFSDTLEVGEGQNFCDRYSKLANVYWEDSDIKVGSEFLPESLSHFRECNDKLRELYEYYLDVLANNLGDDVHDLEFAEVGCNSGYFLHGLALRGAKKCKGYDMGNFKQAFEWFNRVFGLHSEFHFAEWDKLNHRLNHADFPVVDVTLTAHVLVHLPDPMHHLAYLCDHTKKAIFILTFFNKHDDLSVSFGNPSKYIPDLDYPINFDNGVSFSVPLLELALKQSGFEKIIQVDLPEHLEDMWNEDFGRRVFDFPVEGKAFIAFRTKDIKTALSKRKDQKHSSYRSTSREFSEPALLTSFLNYNLVQYTGSIYGLPQSIGHVHLPDKTEEERLGFINGKSEGEVKTLILQEASKNSDFPIPISLFEIKTYQLEELDYYYRCLSTGVPYFGRVMRALQGLPVRHAHMQQLVKSYCSSTPGKPFEVLEIGSWAGGSAITWADAINKFNLGKGKVTCIDAWAPYFETLEALTDLSEDAQMHYQEMTDSLADDKIYKLFCHNIKAAGHDNIVASLRGMSGDLLPNLETEAFNLVFIDGDHRYSSVLSDIRHALRLVADGGIICGDDLELQLTQIDFENAHQHRDVDYILDPFTNQHFHPGVTLAVAEVFGDVSAWDGCWAMQKKGDQWHKVDLYSLGESDTVTIPRHLTNYYATPQLIESIETYNIVAWRENYYGLPHSLGTIDLSTENLAEIEESDGVFISQSQLDIKKAIQVYLKSGKTLNLSSLGEKVDMPIISKYSTNYYATPQLIESIETYNIVAWQEHYYGLPHSLGAVDLSTENLTEIEESDGVFISQSQSDIKKAVQTYLKLEKKLAEAKVRLQVLQKSPFWILCKIWLRLKGIT